MLIFIAQKAATKLEKHIAEAAYANSASERMATVIIPPSLAKVMSRLVEIALIPLGANFRTNCVDGALLQAKAEPTRTEDKIRSGKL